MRFRVSIHGFALGAFLVLAGCGAKKASTPDDGGLPVDDSGYDSPAPSPGVCHQLCCSDSDCTGGGTCTALMPADGTLGVCMGGSASDGGTTGDGGVSTGEAGLPASDAGIDPSCWSQNPGCNPLTNAGCQAGLACDVTGLVAGSVPQVECAAGNNIQGANQTCDNTNGPFCIPGYHCVSN